MDKKTKTVGPKVGFGAGIIAIGLMLILMPSISQQIADLEYVSSDSFAILTGSVLVLAIIIMLAGIGIIFTKFENS